MFTLVMGLLGGVLGAIAVEFARDRVSASAARQALHSAKVTQK